MQLMLKLGCARNTAALRAGRRKQYCLLFDQLKIESDLRGLNHPQPPYGVGGLRRDAL
jgi:hypothetical protein